MSHIEPDFALDSNNVDTCFRNFKIKASAADLNPTTIDPYGLVINQLHWSWAWEGQPKSTGALSSMEVRDSAG